MAEQTMDALVLKDSEGNLYVFDRDAFERARVTDAALKTRLENELPAGASEVSGHLAGQLPQITLPTLPRTGGGTIGGIPPILTGFIGPTFVEF